MILNLQNVYYLLTSPYNLVNLGLLNNSRIFYDNGNKTLYQLGNNKILAQARQQRNTYLLKPLNLSDTVVFLVQIGDKTYKQLLYVFLNLSLPQTFLPLIIWHKRLRHIKFSSLKAYLKKLGVSYMDNSEKHVYNSC